MEPDLSKTRDDGPEREAWAQGLAGLDLSFLDDEPERAKPERQDDEPEWVKAAAEMDLSFLDDEPERSRAWRALARAREVDPDSFARARQNAEGSGLKLTAAPQAVRRLDVGVDLAGLEQKAPLTLRFLSDPERAALAKDDSEALARLERRLLAAGPQPDPRVQDRRPGALYRFDRAVAEWAHEHKDLPVVGWWLNAALTGEGLPEPLRRVLRDVNTGAAGMAAGAMDFWAGTSGSQDLWSAASDLNRMIQEQRVQDPTLFDELAGAAGSMLFNLALGIATGAAGAAAGLSTGAVTALGTASSAALESMTEGGGVMRQVREQGGDPSRAKWAGWGTFLANLPVNYFLNILGGPAGGRLLKRFVAEGLKEGGQESIQGFISEVAAKLGLDPKNLNLGTFLDALDPSARLKEFFIGGVVGGLAGGLLDTSGHTWRQSRPAVDAPLLVKTIAAAAQESKLAGRAPEAFEEFVASALEKAGAPAELFLPARQAQTLFQQALEKGDLDPVGLSETLERAGLDPADFQEAADLDETVRVETAKAHHLAGAAAGVETLFQAEIPKQGNAAAALKEVMAESTPLPFEAMEEFARQAVAAGEDPEVARQAAQVAGHLARIWGIHAGQDPAQWFERYIAGVVGPGGVAPPSGGRRGRAERLFIPGQRPRAVRYELREAGELVPSHDPATFAPHKDYPQGVQERDYAGEPEEQAKVKTNAKMTAPEYFVNTNPDAINGPPIVTPEGVVLGGNSRVMSLALAYQGKPGERYRKFLASRARVFGLDPSQVLAMKQPVLVRVLESKAKDPGSLHRLASALNAPPTQAMGEEAAAVSRGRNTSPGTLRMIAGRLAERDATVRGLLDDPKTARQVLDALTRDGVIKKNETNRYWSSQHRRITNQGKHLVESALLGAVLPDYNLLRVAPPWLRQHLARNLDHLSRLKARGEAWDLTSDLRQAVELVLAAEASPGPVDQLRQFLAQMALPGTERVYSPRAQALALALVEKSPKQLRAALGAMAADAAADVPGQASLVPVKSAAQSFAEHLGRVDSLGQAAAMRRTRAESLPEFVAQVHAGEGGRKEFFDLDAPPNVQRLAASALGQVPDGLRLVVSEDTVRHVDKRRREFAEVAWGVFPDLSHVVDEVYRLPSRGRKWGQPLVFIKRLPEGVIGFLAQFRPSFGGHLTVATYFSGSERQLEGWLKTAGAEKKGSLDAGGSPADPSLARVQDVVQRNPSAFSIKSPKEVGNPLGETLNQPPNPVLDLEGAPADKFSLRKLLRGVKDRLGKSYSDRRKGRLDVSPAGAKAAQRIKDRVQANPSAFSIKSPKEIGNPLGETLNQPLNPGVNLEARLPVVAVAPRLAGKELHHLRNISKGKLAKLFPGVLGVWTNQQGGLRVEVSKQSLHEAKSGSPASPFRATKDHFEILAAIPQVIEKGYLVESYPDHKGDRTLQAMHRIYAPVRVGSRTYAVRLSVKEFKDGFARIDWDGTKINKLYAQSLEKKISAGSPPAGPPGGRRATGAPADTFSLADLLRGVKDSQGITYLLEQGGRGAVHFGPDGKAIIQLFKDADASTLIHELGHIARRSLAEVAAMPDAPQRARRDWQAMCRFVGADPADPWTTGQEEKLAQAFEQYLLEGKAPSPTLRGAFERFRRWLLDLYRGLRGQRFEINDQVRQVFDRLLALDSEIAQARAQAEIHPWLRDEDIPLSERQGYQDLVEAARAQAAQNVMEFRLKKYKKRLAAWRKEGKELADAHPGHEVLDEIMAAGGVSARSLARFVDEPTLRKLAKKRVGLVRKTGQDFVEAAFAMDMTPVELVETILNTPTKKQIIDQHLKKRTAEYEAEIEPFEMAASRELEALLEKEAEFLENKAGVGLGPAFKRVFLDGDMSVADLEAMHMGDMLNDYRKVARLAREAYQGGRLEEAAKERRRQAAKARKLRQLREARREIKAHKVYLNRVVRLKEQPLENSGGIEEAWLQQIRGLVGRYLRLPQRYHPRPDTPSLSEFVKSLPEDECPPISPELVEQTGPWSLAELQKRALYKKDGQPRKQPLTLLGALDRGMLAELVEAVKVLEHVGRREKEYIAFHKQMAMGEAVASLVRAVRENFGDKFSQEPPEITVGESARDEAKRGVKEVSANLEIPEFIVRRLDGYQEMGPVWDLVFKPINDAANQELTLAREAAGRIRELYQMVPAKVRRSWAKRRHIQGLKQTLTGQECLCAALNMGNQENQEALQAGYGWSDEQLSAVLDTLTKEEWDFVQAVWDYLDTFFPAIDETHYQLFGRRVVKVVPQEVETKYGTYRGGYYPLQFDRRKSRAIERFRQREADLDAREHEFQVPWIRRGFTMKRMGGKHPLVLDLAVLSGHVAGAIHFISHAEAVRSVHRLLKDEAARVAVETAVGEARYKQLMTWLVGVARPERVLAGAGEAWLKAMNDNYVTAALAYNLMTALKQPLALGQGAARVGVRPLLRAMASLAASPVETIRHIQEMSPYMLNRQKSLDRDLSKAIRQDWGGPEAWGQKYIREWGFKHIGFMDTLTAYPVWLAAYNQGLAKFKGDQARAVDLADMQVRNTQGSGLPKDLAAVMRGNEWQRAFTMFYTFFSSTYNLMLEETGMLARERFRPRALMRYLTAMSLIWFIPTILEGMMNRREAWEPKDALWDLLLFPLTAVPYLREAASAFQGYRFGGGAFGEAIKLTGGITRTLAAEEPDYGRLAEKGVRLLGTLPLQRWGLPGYAGLPSGQMSTAWRGARDLAEGETDLPEGFAYLFVRRKEKR